LSRGRGRQKGQGNMNWNQKSWGEEAQIHNLMEEARGRNKTCFWCNRVGYYASDCWITSEKIAMNKQNSSALVQYANTEENKVFKCVTALQRSEVANSIVTYSFRSDYKDAW